MRVSKCLPCCLPVGRLARVPAVDQNNGVWDQGGARSILKMADSGRQADNRPSTKTWKMGDLDRIDCLPRGEWQEMRSMPIHLAYACFGGLLDGFVEYPRGKAAGWQRPLPPRSTTILDSKHNESIRPYPFSPGLR